MQKILIADKIESCEKKVRIIFKRSRKDDFRRWTPVIKKRKEALLHELPFQYKQIKNKVFFDLSVTDYEAVFLSYGRYDLYFKDNQTGEIYRLSIQKQENREKEARYFSVFQLTSTSFGVSYLTLTFQLSFYIHTKESVLADRYEMEAFLQKISRKNHKLRMIFRIEAGKRNFSVQGIVFKHRKGQEEIQLKIINQKGEEGRFYAELETSKYEWKCFYWDAFIEVKVAEQTIFLRVKNHKLINKLKLQYFSKRYEEQMEKQFFVTPYITTAEQFSISYRTKSEYEFPVYKWREAIAYLLYFLTGWFFSFFKIWLIHEKFSETAQDNAFAFFKYCYTNHYDKKVYYVMKKDSPDAVLTKPYKKRVVQFMSIKHLFLLLIARRIVSSEAKGHGYAWRASQGFIYPVLLQKPYVFLQHGVLGLKKIDTIFKVHGINHADLFVASFEFEKEIIKKYLGYADKNIIVTGLARWDELLKRDKTCEGQEILCMPTWRKWLEEVNEEQFLASDYYKIYSHLINSSALYQVLKKNNIKLNFYLHPKFIEYANLFQSDNAYVRILSFGEEELGQLIKNAQMLITDYSSVAWEFLHIEKPTLFFQFDIERYLCEQGSYLDMKKDLFGLIAYDEAALIANLEEMINQDFKYSPVSTSQKEKPTCLKNNQHCQQIFDAINELEKTEKWHLLAYGRLKRNPIARTLWTKIKSNKLIIAKKRMEND
ncbi:CDP-glycerol glycerophosphotransferase family protein [Listeria costaricensis]|uniref:CDP-glycerol glycerophosphotransferase family protein n=1 Tax=Listeria costaricensis TaxID=2026604 RepID=UPI000C08C3A0|nr:CDP-glycerol glycerophosphotransferase family protein [Listeria costaricensis]